MSAPTQDTERDDQGPQLKDKRPPLSPIRRRSMGVALILVMLLIVGLCLANFNKVFKPTETVYLRTATVGNQLSKQGDVKVRGVIVGEITSIDSDGSGAVIEMAMSPDFLPTIPSNTTATLIPKNERREVIVRYTGAAMAGTHTATYTAKTTQKNITVNVA